MITFRDAEVYIDGAYLGSARDVSLAHGERWRRATNCDAYRVTRGVDEIVVSGLEIDALGADSPALKRLVDRRFAALRPVRCCRCGKRRPRGTPCMPCGKPRRR